MWVLCWTARQHDTGWPEVAFGALITTTVGANRLQRSFLNGHIDSHSWIERFPNLVLDALRQNWPRSHLYEWRDQVQ